MLGSILSYVGGIFLLMSFCAPYWISSYEESFSEFKNMGLWEYCFKDFRYPYYQFPTTFDGCHHIFSHEYYVIREWLLPGWLMVVQTFVTLSFLLTFGALVVMSMELVRWPLKFVLQYEWVLTRASFYCISASCKWRNSAFPLCALYTDCIIFQPCSCSWPWLCLEATHIAGTG